MKKVLLAFVFIFLLLAAFIAGVHFSAKVELGIRTSDELKKNLISPDYFIPVAKALENSNEDSRFMYLLQMKDALNIYKTIIKCDAQNVYPPTADYARALEIAQALSEGICKSGTPYECLDSLLKNSRYYNFKCQGLDSLALTFDILRQ